MRVYAAQRPALAAPLATSIDRDDVRATPRYANYERSPIGLWNGIPKRNDGTQVANGARTPWFASPSRAQVTDAPAASRYKRLLGSRMPDQEPVAQ